MGLFGSFVSAHLAYYGYRFTVSCKTFGLNISPLQACFAGHYYHPAHTPQFYGQPKWEILLTSWREQPGDYYYDQQIGGFGRQWLYLEFPALLAATLLALKRRRFDFLLAAASFWLLFIVQPANWWTRYTIFFVALGVVSLAWVSQQLPRWPKAALQAATLALVCFSLYCSTTHGYFSLPRIQRFLQLPPASRSVSQLGFRCGELAWVDQVPPGSHIGYTRSLFVYPCSAPICATRSTCSKTNSRKRSCRKSNKTR
jgi:hypothetical protein